MKLLDLYAKMKSDLNRIERRLEKTITSDHALLNETALHLLKAGGKRIRPVFVLLSGKFGNGQIEVLEKIAVTLELIHMASLVHDDVIDDAETRRGQLTVKAKWDNRIAMYTGDYIHGKALTVATDLEDPAIHRILSKAMVEMCIGEMEQIRDFFNTSQSVRNYLLRIRRKTALLIAISCQLGALGAESGHASAARLYRFGYNIGMVFQIRDDLLDICGTEKQIGKPPGSDIRQGNMTLPVLLALRDTSVREPLLHEIRMLHEAEGQGDTSQILKLIRSSKGIEQADHMATRYMEKAIHALAGLPDIPAKKSLSDLAYFVAKRNY
ncbi:heptaprenyl diphosphate synthase [Paenibacillaceae bacterium]|nr:heptaprenyl diphosphate synthase [Paenibacillaceae bacterium]